jgi:hypothetical protein
LECVCEKGYTGDACETYSLISTIAYHSGAPIWFVVLVFIVLFAALVLLMLKHKDKVKLLARGEFEAVFPALFGRRAAHDGKGFYSRVDDPSGYDPYANTDRHTTPPGPSTSAKSPSSTKRKDVQMTSGANPFSGEENFTL